MQHVFQTLSEQLSIGEYEIERRKAYMGIGSDDEIRLKQVEEWIKPHLDELVQEFYMLQTMIPEIKLKIDDEKTLGNLYQNLYQYVLSLFSGQYDMAYVEQRLRIGQVHERMGVSPKLYFSGMNQLQILLEHKLDEYSAKTAINNTLLKQSMRKVLYFDNQFVFDTYIDALQSEVKDTNQKLEIYASNLEKEIDQRTRDLTELSLRDPLTNLYNQRAFYEHLEKEVALAERNNAYLSMLYIDVNDFKKVNDQYGHLVGDDILIAISQAILKVSRKTETAVRYGGDEFCIILPSTPLDKVHVYIDRLLKQFDLLRAHPVSLSVGGASVNPVQGYDLRNLIMQADREMYGAKMTAHKSGKHEVCLDSTTQ